MATVKEELESAWNPSDMVLAIMRDPERSATVQRELQEAGFKEENVAIFHGHEAADRFDLEGKHASKRWVHPVKAIWSYFSVEGPQLRTYEEASEAGQDIIAVKTVDQADVASAHEVLRHSGATEMRHFTRWNIVDLPEDHAAA